VTPVGVQPRRGHAPPTGRRRAGGAGRFAGEATPRLFPEGDNEPMAVDSPVTASEAAEPRARGTESTGDRGDGLTLEQLICGVWDEVLAEGRATCPLCGGELAARASAHARPTEGCCRDCGTTIA
jgi:hypothetical protein